VIGCTDDPARFAALLPGWRVVCADDSLLGMGASLAAAMVRLPAHWEGCLVALADKPWLRADTVRAVRDALDDQVVVPRHGGEWGHPVGFPRRLFPTLAQLSGESGARQLIEAEGSRCRFIDVDDPGVLQDVDTPEALRATPIQLR
jgi:molybdenum cofactor cytidylyltransferase